MVKISLRASGGAKNSASSFIGTAVPLPLAVGAPGAPSSSCLVRTNGEQILLMVSSMAVAAFACCVLPPSKRNLMFWPQVTLTVVRAAVIASGGARASRVEIRALSKLENKM